MNERYPINLTAQRIHQILKAGRPVLLDPPKVSERDRKIADLQERIERWSNRPEPPETLARANAYREELALILGSPVEA